MLGVADWVAAVPKLNPVVRLLVGAVVVAATEAGVVPKPNAGGAVETLGCAVVVDGTPKDKPGLY